MGLLQSIRLLPSDDNQVRIEILDTTNILPRSDTETVLSKRSAVTTIISGNTIDITIPNNIFRQEVPFSFAKRVVNIYVPKDKKIIYNNNSELRYSTPGSWIENKDGKEFMMYCTDKLSFLYHTPSDSWRCASTTQSEVNKESNATSGWNGSIPDDIDEEVMERMFLGLTMEQAQVIAQEQDRLLRIVEQDGIKLPIDNDYQPGRLNVEIKNGLITDIEIE